MWSRNTIYTIRHLFSFIQKVILGKRCSLTLNHAYRSKAKIIAIFFVKSLFRPYNFNIPLAWTGSNINHQFLCVNCAVTLEPRFYVKTQCKVTTDFCIIHVSPSLDHFGPIWLRLDQGKQLHVGTCSGCAVTLSHKSDQDIAIPFEFKKNNLFMVSLNTGFKMVAWSLWRLTSYHWLRGLGSLWLP